MCKISALIKLREEINDHLSKKKFGKRNHDIPYTLWKEEDKIWAAIQDDHYLVRELY